MTKIQFSLGRGWTRKASCKLKRETHEGKARSSEKGQGPEDGETPGPRPEGHREPLTSLHTVHCTFFYPKSQIQITIYTAAFYWRVRQRDGNDVGHSTVQRTKSTYSVVDT
jgi:hypothetical protein